MRLVIEGSDKNENQTLASRLRDILSARGWTITFGSGVRTEYTDNERLKMDAHQINPNLEIDVVK